MLALPDPRRSRGAYPMVAQRWGGERAGAGRFGV
jgi:hypothetical protein